MSFAFYSSSCPLSCAGREPSWSAQPAAVAVIVVCCTQASLTGEVDPAVLSAILVDSSIDSIPTVINSEHE